MASLAEPKGRANALEELILGSLSLGSLALWLGFAPMLRPACAELATSEPTSTLTDDCA